MLECAKTIEKDGLVWGAHKLVPVGYGIKKVRRPNIPLLLVLNPYPILLSRQTRVSMLSLW